MAIRLRATCQPSVRSDSSLRTSWFGCWWSRADARDTGAVGSCRWQAAEPSGLVVPSFYKTIDERFGGDYAAYIDYLYKNSVLMQNGKKLYVNKKNVKNDLGVQMGKDLMDFVSAHRQRLSAIAEDIAEQERLLPG